MGGVGGWRGGQYVFLPAGWWFSVVAAECGGERASYGNCYISVLTLRDREVVHWRDYLDPLAVFDALGWPQH